MLQQQLEATLAAAVASRATHGAPGGAGPSGWMMHASALGAFLLLRWITYSGHASGAGVLEDKTLMVLAWPVRLKAAMPVASLQHHKPAASYKPILLQPKPNHMACSQSSTPCGGQRSISKR